MSIFDPHTDCRSRLSLEQERANHWQRAATLPRNDALELELRAQIADLKDQLGETQQRLADQAQEHGRETKQLVDRIIAITTPAAYRMLKDGENLGSAPAAPILDRSVVQGLRPVRSAPAGGARVRPAPEPEHFGNRPVAAPAPAPPPAPTTATSPEDAVLRAAGGNADS